MVLPHSPPRLNNILRTLCITLTRMSRRRMNAIGPCHRDTMNTSTFPQLIIPTTTAVTIIKRLQRMRTTLLPVTGWVRPAWPAWRVSVFAVGAGNQHREDEADKGLEDGEAVAHDSEVEFNCPGGHFLLGARDLFIRAGRETYDHTQTVASYQVKSCLSRMFMM